MRPRSHVRTPSSGPSWAQQPPSASPATPPKPSCTTPHSPPSQQRSRSSPLAPLAAVHGVVVLLRAHAGARGAHLIATVMTRPDSHRRVLAFVHRTTVTRDRRRCPARRSMAVATDRRRLHGTSHRRPARPRPLHHSLDKAKPAGHEPAQGSRPHSDQSTGTDCAETAPATSAAVSSVHTSSRADSTSRKFFELAALLCARDPARRRDPELVAEPSPITTSTAGIPPE
jgi:hypothetical protein